MEILEIKINVTELKHTFDGLITRQKIAEERMSDLKNMSIETSQTKLNEK